MASRRPQVSTSRQRADDGNRATGFGALSDGCPDCFHFYLKDYNVKTQAAAHKHAEKLCEQTKPGNLPTDLPLKYPLLRRPTSKLTSKTCSIAVSFSLLEENG